MANEIDLARLIRQRGLAKRKVFALKPIRPRRSSEEAYRRVLESLLGRGALFVRTTFEPMVARLEPVLVTPALDQLKNLLARLTPEAIDGITRLLRSEATWHREQWMGDVRTLTGVDLTNVISDNDLAGPFDLMVRRNVRLVTNLSDDFSTRVERTVTRATLTGTTAKDFSADLTEQFGFTKQRARLIARDQIAKATGNLNQLRQQQAGIKNYVWSTSLDERVRGNPGGKYPSASPSHWAREGVTFKWDEPPSDGHPGEPVNCRCTARAKIEL